jgi:hypothetical protein
MKSNLIKFFLLFALLAVVPQRSSASASPRLGQNTNSSTTLEAEVKPAKNSRCRTKCRKAFGKCLRVPGTNVRRRCIVRYRNCLRRCTR